MHMMEDSTGCSWMSVLEQVLSDNALHVPGVERLHSQELQKVCPCLGRDQHLKVAIATIWFSQVFFVWAQSASRCARFSAHPENITLPCRSRRQKHGQMRPSQEMLAHGDVMQGIAACRAEA